MERQMRVSTFSTGILLAVLAQISLCTAQQTAPPPAASRCFSASEFENWRAADAKTLFIRVRPQRIFRLDLAGECSLATWPDAHLITKFSGSDTICRAVDWDLKVAIPPNGIPEPCIVKAMTELTPEQAAALPKGQRP